MARAFTRGSGDLLPYPEQQLPGVPHELGFPQQLPGPGSVNFRGELLEVL